MMAAARLLTLLTGVGALFGGAGRAAVPEEASEPATSRPSLLDRLGDLAPHRVSTVAADDGTPLVVSEIDPEGDRVDLTVVGVHGFALSQRSWHFQRYGLAGGGRPRIRQVYYDHRGHGSSGAATAGTSTIEQLADDLDAVLRTVAPTGPVVLMGHSMGGMVIMELAQRNPALFRDRVRGVALIATAAGEVGREGVSRSLLSKYNPLTRGVGGLAGWQPGLVEFVRAAGGQLTRPALRRLSFGSGDVPRKVVDFMIEMLAVTPVRVLVEFADTLDRHHRYEALAGLRHVHVLVVGAEKDRLTPISHAERIAAELPDAELARIPGAGHMVQLEQPGLVNARLNELLRRCAGVEGMSASQRIRRWRKR
ncbi:alpha/beta hydrolase [Amycolatopsis cynarae]|uniref:Alpha/beta hydrolase n=2 Tax=Amycolatopsis cynarae TaxID=2995223 RepID=A0ABY7AYK1_9PSEU|nr:alpha/beta hydrolase [Amycolatopsis sp. HUAS 11-8]WAL65102.1 alpha/beta hydrolase [Amycolatopsis sp. HUAS 11-8]